VASRYGPVDQELNVKPVDLKENVDIALQTYPGIRVKSKHAALSDYPWRVVNGMDDLDCIGSASSRNKGVLNTRHTKQKASVVVESSLVEMVF
jgi:hypothetical protein